MTSDFYSCVFRELADIFKQHPKPDGDTAFWLAVNKVEAGRPQLKLFEEETRQLKLIKEIKVDI